MIDVRNCFIYKNQVLLDSSYLQVPNRKKIPKLFPVSFPFKLKVKFLINQGKRPLLLFIHTRLDVIKPVFNPGETLGMTNQKITAILKATVKFIDQRFPGLFIKVDHYVSTKNKMKTVDQLPIVMLTVEEAPSILGSQMSKEGNVFIDISRQGRKFRIGLLLITQNISSMEPIILANTNTELNMMLGNEIEVRMAIINASNNIAGYENEFKVLSRGEAILTNSLRNSRPFSVRK